MWSSLNEWLWQDRFWLPPNNSWADLEDRDGLVYAHPQDLLAAVPLALALVAMRFTFERWVSVVVLCDHHLVRGFVLMCLWPWTKPPLLRPAPSCPHSRFFWSLVAVVSQH